MDNTTLIRDTILDNRENVAFVIGNGINLRFFDEKAILPWPQMLKELSKHYLKDIPEDSEPFPLTELYDLIELEAIKENGLKERFIDFSKNDNVASIKTYKSNKIDYDKIQHIVNESIMENNVILPNPKNKEIERYKKVYLEYIRGCRKWCERNRNDGKNLSDEQCIEYFMDYASNSSKIAVLKNTVKQSVVKMYSKKLDCPEFTVCSSFFKNNDVPILTTNFDTLIAHSLNLTKRKMGKSFTVFYPWNVYYSDRELDCPISGFGIWHINGVVEYP